MNLFFGLDRSMHLFFGLIDRSMHLFFGLDRSMHLFLGLDRSMHHLSIFWFGSIHAFLVDRIETWIFVSDPTIIGSTILVPNDLWIYFADPHVYFQIYLATPKRNSDCTTCATIKKTYDHQRTYAHTHPD